MDMKPQNPLAHIIIVSDKSGPRLVARSDRSGGGEPTIQLRDQVCEMESSKGGARLVSGLNDARKYSPEEPVSLYLIIEKWPVSEANSLFCFS